MIKDIMSRNTIKYIVLIVLLSTYKMFSQVYPVQLYTVENGLRSINIMSVTKDKFGKIWCTTASGISVYDGKKWEDVIDPSDTQKKVYAKILCDSSGKIWAFPRAFYLNPKYFYNNSWHRIKAPERIAASKSWLKSVDILYHNNKPVICAVVNSEVAVYKNGEWNELDVYKNQKSFPVYSTLVFNNKFILTTGNGIILYNPFNEQVENIQINFPKGISSTIFAAKAYDDNLLLLGDKWVGVLKNNNLKILCSGFDIPILDLHNGFYIAKDKRDIIYFGNYYKKYLFDQRSSKAQPLFTRNGFITDGAVDIFIDDENNIWFPTLRGLNKFNNFNIKNYFESSGLLENEVTAILQTKDGKYIFGHNTGFTVFKEGKFYKYYFDKTKLIMSFSARILDMCEDKEGDIWMASSFFGLGKLSKNGGFNFVKSKISGSVTSVVTDKKNIIWVASNKLIYNLVNGKLVKKNYLSEKINNVRKIVSLDDDLFFLTFQGLYKYDGKNLVSYSFDPNETTSIFSLYKDNIGRIFVGTSTGLYIISDQEVIKFKLGDFFIDNPVYFIVQDTNGNYWFGTNDGVINWNGKDEFRSIGIKDGLAGRETNRSAVCIDNEQNLWIGTDQGVSCYDYNKEDRDIPVPKIYLGNLTEGKNSYSLKDAIELDSYSNSFSLEVRALSYQNEFSLEYQVKLEGYDTSWVNYSQSYIDKLSYKNLYPGKYYLLVRARNPFGKWSEIQKSNIIFINKPYYLKWWFITIFVFIIIFLIFLVIVFYYQKIYLKNLENVVAERTEELNKSKSELIKINEELEERVRLRTAELVDANNKLQEEIIEKINAQNELILSVKEKELLLKEIHHRVKNNLQIISSLLNLQKAQIKDENDLVLFKESQDRVKVMALIHEQLYKTEHVEMINFAAYIRALVNSIVASYNVGNKVQIKLDVDENYIKIDQVTLCGLILNELVTNSLKYAFVDKEIGEILIKFKCKKSCILSVIDNGSGISSEVELLSAKTLGLRLVRILTEQLNGQMEIVSNNGTAINIIFNNNMN